jgi:predicted TIM-barrel fold metal-dependent hydrolase
VIIDVHTHAFPDKIAERAIEALTKNSGEYKPVIGGRADALLSSMDESGVDVSFIGNIATRPGQADSILSWSKTIASERMIPLGSVHPDSEDWEREIDAFAAAGFRGMKFHPQYQGIAADDPKMIPIYQKIASCGMCVLFHAGFDIAFPGDESAAPERFPEIKKAVPSLLMILAHMGGWRAWDRVMDCIAGRDMYIDTSFIQELSDHQRTAILSRHSEDMILFGSDSPWTSQAESIEYIRRLSISDDRKMKILGGNAATLLPPR